MQEIPNPSHKSIHAAESTLSDFESISPLSLTLHVGPQKAVQRDVTGKIRQIFVD